MNPVTATPTAWRFPVGTAAQAAAVAITFFAMLGLTWGSWPDVLVDFGHELYDAWRLSEGAVLGRDVLIDATGSLPPYLNALLFKVFGVGLRTLVVCNLAWLCAITWLLYVMLREIAGRVWATAAIIFFLAVFAFAQYVGIGNYNYVTPYSHGMTHGLLLSLLAIAFRWRFARTHSFRDLMAASLCLGLVALTKPEIFLAAAGAAAVDLALRLRATADASVRRRVMLAATLPALLPPAVSLLTLSAAAGTAPAWEATFAPWIAAGSPLVQTPFYVAGLGLDDPLGNLLSAGKWLAAGAALLIPVALIDVCIRGQRASWVAALLAVAGVAAVCWAWVPLQAPFVIPRALPLSMALGGGLVLIQAWRDRPFGATCALHAGLATFAALLLLKMGLNTRIRNYGFVLAMPACLLIVSWLGASVPRLLRARGGTGLVFQSVVAITLVFFAVACVRVTVHHAASKTITVGTGPDAFIADERGGLVNAVMHRLDEERRPEATMTVLPEGVMINYLTRRASPSPYPAFMPNAIAWKGEASLLAPLQARPPDYIVIVSRDASEWGGAVFGRDYARSTLEWIDTNYELLGSAGGSPLTPGELGIALLRERGSPGAYKP